jgi:hypothetical protein
MHGVMLQVVEIVEIVETQLGGMEEADCTGTDSDRLVQLGKEYLEILGREEAEFYGSNVEAAFGARFQIHPLLDGLRHLLTRDLRAEKRQRVIFPPMADASDDTPEPEPVRAPTRAPAVEKPNLRADVTCSTGSKRARAALALRGPLVPRKPEVPQCIQMLKTGKKSNEPEGLCAAVALLIVLPWPVFLEFQQCVGLLAGEAGKGARGPSVIQQQRDLQHEIKARATAKLGKRGSKARAKRSSASARDAPEAFG